MFFLERKTCNITEFQDSQFHSKQMRSNNACISQLKNGKNKVKKKKKKKNYDYTKTIKVRAM